MAYNVFGCPITNSTLEGMPEYAGKKIERIDRARVAFNKKNLEDKDVKARKYVEHLKKKWGIGVSTLCLVYNATGDTVTYVGSHDWHGHIGSSPYPAEIANGQWGLYLHVKTALATTGSSAAVVYRGKNNVGVECDWMLAWSNPWFRIGRDNKNYTEIQQAHHYDNDEVWDSISGSLDKCGVYSSDEWNGCLSTVISGSYTSPIFEAILVLSNALLSSD